MASDDNITADAFSRALGSLFDLGQAGVDWISVWRAVVEFRQEERERWLDQHDELSRASAQSIGVPERFSHVANAGGDTAALMILIQATLLSSTLRLGRDWQRFLRESAPALKRAADRYQSELDPSPRSREELIEQVRIFVHGLSEFARDQGARIGHDLTAAADEILARADRRSIARSLRSQID